MSHSVTFRLLPFLLSLLSLPTMVRAQAAVDSQFLALEQAWMDALAAKDTAQLQRLLAAEFTIIGTGQSADERPATRALWLANAVRFNWPTHKVRLLGVRPLGSTTVVQAVLTATFPPRSITPEGGLLTFLVTDTWIERDGRWQVVSRHASLAASPR